MVSRRDIAKGQYVPDMSALAEAMKGVGVDHVVGTYCAERKDQRPPGRSAEEICQLSAKIASVQKRSKEIMFPA